MTKRRLLRWSLILAIFAAFAVWLEPTRVIWGWLRGEAFYNGRPTSYWRQECLRWEQVQVEKTVDFRFRDLKHWRWTATAWEQRLGTRKSYTLDEPRPFGKDDDPAALPVVSELLADPSPSVREVATWCLKRIAAEPHDDRPAAR